eukprot:gene9435-biopygen12224
MNEDVDEPRHLLEPRLWSGLSSDGGKKRKTHLSSIWRKNDGKQRKNDGKQRRKLRFGADAGKMEESGGKMTEKTSSRGKVEESGGKWRTRGGKMTEKQALAQRVGQIEGK